MHQNLKAAEAQRLLEREDVEGAELGEDQGWVEIEEGAAGGEEGEGEEGDSEQATKMLPSLLFVLFLFLCAAHCKSRKIQG